MSEEPRPSDLSDAEIAEFERVLSVLTPQEPSAKLKQRVLSLPHLTHSHRRRWASLSLVASAVAACLAFGFWLLHRGQHLPIFPAPVDELVMTARSPESTLLPLFSNREVVDQSAPEITFVEGVGALEKNLFTVMEVDIWASEDGTHVFTSSQPRQHIVFLPLSYQ